MTDKEIYQRAKEIIGDENILEYRPAVFDTAEGTMLEGISAFVPDTIMIWLKNGDCIWYRVNN